MSIRTPRIMETATATDFYGNPIIHERDLPASIDGLRKWEYTEIDYTKQLPIDGYLKGMKLISFEPHEDDDPVCLYDCYGRIIKQWESMPHYDELADVIRNTK